MAEIAATRPDPAADTIVLTKANDAGSPSIFIGSTSKLDFILRNATLHASPTAFSRF